VARSPRTVLFEVALALVFAGVAGLAAYYGSQRLPARFEATARFEVVRDTLLTGDRPADLYRLAPRRDDVLADALRALGVSDPQNGQVEALRERVAADYRRGENGGATLLLSVRGDEETDVRAQAEAVADAMASWDRASARDRLQRTAQELDARIAQLGERIRAQQVLGIGAPSDGLEELVRERDRAIAERERAGERLGSDDPIRSLRGGRVSVEQIGPRPLRNAVAAAGLAAVLSLLLGFRLPRRASRRAAPKARPDASDEPLLATFPRAGEGDDAPLRGAAARLRSAVLSRTVGAQPRVVLVTGVTGRAGTTTVACCLADELARQGRRTLLVDGDLWGPGVARRYELPERFADATSATSTLEWLQGAQGRHRVVSVPVDGDASLDVVPQYRATRPAPGTAAALFEGFGAAVERWSDYEVVVVDTAAVTAVEDTRLLARFATAVVLVVPRGARDERGLREARSILREAGTSLLGMVENDVPPVPEADVVVREEPDAYPRVVRRDATSADAIRDRLGSTRRRRS
jgi:Mrp family chromosome partitioning ATPase